LQYTISFDFDEDIDEDQFDMNDPANMSDDEVGYDEDDFDDEDDYSEDVFEEDEIIDDEDTPEQSLDDILFQEELNNEDDESY